MYPEYVTHNGNNFRLSSSGTQREIVKYALDNKRGGIIVKFRSEQGKAFYEPYNMPQPRELSEHELCETFFGMVGYGKKSRMWSGE